MVSRLLVPRVDPSLPLVVPSRGRDDDLPPHKWSRRYESLRPLWIVETEGRSSTVGVEWSRRVRTEHGRRGWFTSPTDSPR